MEWAPYYPGYFALKGVEPMEVSTVEGGEGADALAMKKHAIVDVVDIGCGFGGLLVSLGPQLPNSVILGLYIATAHFRGDKIWALTSW